MSLLIMKLIFLDAMFYFASHERIRILLEDAQAGAGAEVDAFTSIHGAGIFGWIFEYPSAGSFIFGQWGASGFSQNSFPFAAWILSINLFNDQLAAQHPHLALEAKFTCLIGCEFQRHLFAFGQ